MRNIVRIVVALSVALTSLASSSRGTPEEAKALLDKAIAHYKAAGQKQALADFNSDRKHWVDRDLYVFCVDRKGLTLANGGFPARVGEPVAVLKTKDGTLLSEALWKAVAAKGEGEVHYSWTHPQTGKTEPKVSFVRKAGEIVCGVGAYSGS